MMTGEDFDYEERTVCVGSTVTINGSAYTVTTLMPSRVKVLLAHKKYQSGKKKAQWKQERKGKYGTK